MYVEKVGECMANLNSIAKKLQKAILQKGLVIKMGTSQFYSIEQNRLITMYILSTRVLERKTGNGNIMIMKFSEQHRR